MGERSRERDDHATPNGKVRVGVSACLLGQAVRYDGGHKRDAYVADALASHFCLVPVCPEVELGLGVPRETLRLVRRGGELRMRSASGVDHTARMRAYARRRVSQLQELALAGYILKKSSPSCGMARVKTYTEAGRPAPADRGLFADALLAMWPLLPVEEEGRLSEPRLRESFIVRVFAYHRLRALFAGRWRLAELIAFQAREKLLLMAHDPKRQRELERLVAAGEGHARGGLRGIYADTFMAALARPATAKRQANALQHMFGYLRERLGAAERAQLLAAIEDYQAGLLPLVVPVTLISHYVKSFDLPYLREQTYLSPHPKELALRNRV